ncbi:hypothetical protein H6763_01360 [Candidatus Nomurabacteria bacterium]|uniref:Uncharacterized protein n=1 Tax=Candidatus Dojkabacteria bacterium TaxID=2099670 RepID=A0A955KY20_9BACT|nr:hypothetical protein [Candidatus Dojkabacteria bacterium]MCB9789919.1 hypothetical protein [Candidatus Nomurabacteria bacterium]MCB9803455.1 hypothetical protein [Candidatus Nomurabacteria bacterium]
MKEPDQKIDKKDQLQDQINTLNRSLEKLTSLRYQFIKGVYSGLGSAVGATLIFAIMIILIDRLIRQIGDIPVIAPLLEFINASIGK